MNFFYEHRDNAVVTLRNELEWGAHLHSDIEIVHMIEGFCESYIDGEKYELKAGDCMIVFPNRVHNFKKGVGDIADVIIVSPEALPEYKNIFAKKLPVCPCVNNVSSIVGSMFDAAYKCEGKFAESIKRGYCTAILGILFEQMEFIKIGSGENKSIQNILEYCAENYKTDISVSDVSEKLNLSESYISHLFSEKLCIGFRQYINSLRINEAMRLIDEGVLSTTEIAYETGFGTTRTFNRAFSAHAGCSPSEYKKR